MASTHVHGMGSMCLRALSERRIAWFRVACPKHDLVHSHAATTHHTSDIIPSLPEGYTYQFALHILNSLDLAYASTPIQT